MAEDLRERLWRVISAADLPAVSAILKEQDISGIEIPHDIVARNVTVGLLETLVTHGYDINLPGSAMPSTRSRTLIDYPGVLKKEDVVRWLVDHGARLDRGQDIYDVLPMPAPLLETAASHAPISTFKFLQDRGAKLGRRTLHLAVEHAAGIRLDVDAPLEHKMFESSVKFAGDRRRLREMLPYLVDDMKLDVNASDWVREDLPVPTAHWGTPLQYAVYADGPAIVKWLLGKGADPQFGHPRYDALREANVTADSKCSGILKEWENTHSQK